MPGSYDFESRTLQSPRFTTTTISNNIIAQHPTVYALTGGCGYVGERLALALLHSDPNCLILLLDVQPPHISSILYSNTIATHANSKRILYRHCDLTNQRCLQYAFGKWNDLYDIQCVIHIASYGMSGAEMLHTERTKLVNITGTQYIVDVCKQYGITQLIYISTYNVVFGGKELINIDETTPYFPVDQHNDAYSSSKCIAEQLVLHANNTKCEDGRVLHTCALRPAAIYGDGEKKHFPRIFATLDTGFGSLFWSGENSNKVDWVYVDNLVHAIQCAVKHVDTVAAGQAYFISDCRPIANFEFLNEVAKRCDYPNCFIIRLPTPIMLQVARCFEVMHHYISKYIKHEPYLTRTEVLKIAVTHYASCDKAKRDLQYEPIIQQSDAIDKAAAYYRQAGYGYKPWSWTYRMIKIVLLMYILRAFQLRYSRKA